MDNPKTVVTMGTQETGRRQTKQKTQPRKLKTMSFYAYQPSYLCHC